MVYIRILATILFFCSQNPYFFPIKIRVIFGENVIFSHNMRFFPSQNQRRLLSKLT